MEAILAFVGGVAAALIGAVVAVGIEIWRRRRRVLGWEMLSANVIIPFESRPGGDLEVRVRSSLVEDDDGDEFVPAGKVYGFRVCLKNVGNVPIEAQEVFLSLDPAAKMLSLEVEEAPLELLGRIETQRQHENRFTGRCVLPFLNPGQELTLSAQSVDNELRGCIVYAPGAGLTLRDIDFGRGLATLAAFLGILASILGVNVSAVLAIAGPWGFIPAIAIAATAASVFVLSILVLIVWGEGLRVLLPGGQSAARRRRS